MALVVKQDSLIKPFTDASAVTSDALRLFYNYIFPLQHMTSWLSDCKGSMMKREWSFTLEDDVYVRYLAFGDSAQLKEGLLARLPYKIDIGAVYNFSPNAKERVHKFVPERKEFVLDIDMTDYDDVRACCTEAAICVHCWTLMTVAIDVIDFILRQDFAFRHILWVFSGRRGVHCWVSDERAQMMSAEERTALAEYLSLHSRKPGSESKELVKEFKLFPSLQRAFAVCENHFKALMIRKQGLLNTEESCRKLIALLPPDAKCKPDFSIVDPIRRWEEFKRQISQMPDAAPTLVARIVFHFCYPRLDINVSKQMNHLLKAPFSVHPKTGRICVPIETKKADEFNPFQVPTLRILCDEMRQIDKQRSCSRDCAWQLTSLAPYLRTFQQFVDTYCKSKVEPVREGDDW